MDEPIISLDTITNKIIAWGVSRMIVQNSTALAQSRKTIEEVHEMVEAATLEQYRPTVSSRELLKDAIGDVFVTLVMAAECNELTINECIQKAYNDIKGRKGHLRPDGVFVKEEVRDGNQGTG